MVLQEKIMKANKTVTIPSGAEVKQEKADVFELTEPQ